MRPANAVAQQARCGCYGTCERKTPKGPIYGRTWSHCPVALCDSPWWERVRYLTTAQEAQPLTGWPEAYSAGASSAILTLRAERKLAIQREAERRARR